MCMRELADTYHPEAELSPTVLDSLSAHTAGAVHETFPALKAHRILRRLEFHHTPKQATWFNMVKIEISVLRGQCLDRRVSERKRLVAEIATQCVRPLRQANSHHPKRTHQACTGLFWHAQTLKITVPKH